VILALLAAMTVEASGGAAGRSAAIDARVTAAIIDAVRTRMGDEVEVSVSDVIITGRVTGTSLVATPVATARSGQPVLFALSEASATGARHTLTCGDSGGARHTLIQNESRCAWHQTAPRRRVGAATAIVGVSARHAEAVRALSKGAVLVAADLRESDGALIGVPLRRLPTVETLRGGRLVRDVGVGDVLTHQLVQPVPFVRSGDLVTVHVRIGPVAADGRAVASQSGGPGDVIRLVNPESRRSLRGRIVAPGEVEVVNES
jgi:flagella basal body P-ring formation protein FlgA